MHRLLLKATHLLAFSCGRRGTTQWWMRSFKSDYLSMRLLLQHPPDGDRRVGDRGTTGVRGVVRRPQESGNSNNGSTAHPTPPEIPLRLRRALSDKPESSTALRMTRAAAQKLSLRRTKKGTALITVPNEGSNTFCRESFGGLGGLFQKSPKRVLASPRPLFHFTTRNAMARPTGGAGANKPRAARTRTAE